MTTIKLFMSGAAAALLLAGCGGGGGSEPAPPPAAHELPATALASTAALVDWGKALPPSDTAAPLDVSRVMLPVSDTEEPRAL